MNSSVVSIFPSTKSTSNTTAKAKTLDESLSSTLNRTDAVLSVEQLRSQSEAFLEASINVAFTRLIGGATKEERLDAWHEFAGLIRQRSPEHVARLEQEKLDRVFSVGRR